jgi:hypothetical protein
MHAPAGFRRPLTIEQLQEDVDAWMEEYNTQRIHSGKYCYGKTPIDTDVNFYREHQARARSTTGSGQADIRSSEGRKLVGVRQIKSRLGTDFGSRAEASCRVVINHPADPFHLINQEILSEQPEPPLQANHPLGEKLWKFLLGSTTKTTL